MISWTSFVSYEKIPYWRSGAAWVEETGPLALQQQGYFTGFVGKW